MASLAGTQFMGELTFAWSYERDGYEGSKARMSCKLANPDSMDSSLINSSHVCRICKREFSSGRALGGHMRAHGSIALENANRGQVWKDQANKMSGNSSSAQNNQIRFRAHAEEGSSPYLGSSCKNNISRSCSSPVDQIFKGKKKFMTGSEDQEADSMRLSSSSDQFFLKKKGYGDPLYGLRRNPKRSRRFVDHEYAMEIASGAPAGKKGGLILQDKAQACTECGKEFSSWKALFGHMRCHPEREWRGIHRPGVEKKLANSRRIMGSLVPAESESESKHTSRISDNGSDTESIEAAYMNGSTGSSLKFEKIRGKGKRSKRSRKFEDPTTPKEIKEAQDMADCLVLLACAGESTGLLENKSDSEDTVSERDETGNWNGFEHVGRKGFYSKTEIDDSSLCGDGFSEEMNDSRIKYECSTCKKVFKTHQALGGHRASHKRVKGCFARTYNGNEEVQESFADEEILTDEEFGFSVRADGQIGRSEERFGQCFEIEESFGRKMKSHHECSICHRVFTSGQALGGHKRCHWGISGNEKFDPGSNSASSSRQSVLVSNSNPPKISNPAKQLRNGKIELLDLNLPAPVEDEDEEQNYDAEAVELGLNLPRLVPAYEFKLSCQVLDQTHGRECFSSSLCLNPAF